ncbi:hypothetical protein THASP1DRAFT_27624 [Thamnocephalis sphaerospora]|uniref:CCHC-type domain-containing protein n=1 Tax=Thamnocephalis sphaerospora TaxID=78915 RepID=A0A4P9XW88_9FUNG|nr:hypothetical protein THASP1DRAFT_27624 [Thamnocephalis sphaerospora]|eukprot:RKP10568.1 hypothetical protein THASP1DRAFT_27624 [Thamnocephalis sphaerospora]
MAAGNSNAWRTPFSTLRLRNRDESELVVLQKAFDDKWREAGDYLTKLNSTKNLKTRHQQVEIGYEDEKALEKAQEKGVSFRGRQIFITRVYEACKTLVEVQVENMRMSTHVQMTKALIESFNPFGKIVDVSLLMVDSGRVMTRYASMMISTVINVENKSRPTLFEVDGQPVLLWWQGMDKMCHYCHQPGHVLLSCEKLIK